MNTSYKKEAVKRTRKVFAWLLVYMIFAIAIVYMTDSDWVAILLSAPFTYIGSNEVIKLRDKLKYSPDTGKPPVTGDK
ncbi:hypothetical protein [Rhizobium tumorigenes]|uniref:Uncharacterized protein n=1 Tax=Rhizobium tumorigenes TaxID=2041385 RepID=A0AAF1KAV5_9HYPH|nr:hypothetical protein [Rhizobium tumorigenes]WFR98729.1 hypothetical protein PR017_23805 [Rhizobium tumorigenes]